MCVAISQRPMCIGILLRPEFSKNSSKTINPFQSLLEPFAGSISKFLHLRKRSSCVCSVENILDVVVDLRRGSGTFGKHLTVGLSAEKGDQLFVPVGFAHGFCTLAPDTEVFYKVDNVYSSAHDRGLNWADPALGIRWPVNESQAILSEKDRALPMLSALPDYF